MVEEFVRCSMDQDVLRCCEVRHQGGWSKRENKRSHFTYRLQVGHRVMIIELDSREQSGGHNFAD